MSFEPFQLFRYMDKQSFQFNSRKLVTAVRFLHSAAGIIGKRLTYAELIGDEAKT